MTAKPAGARALLASLPAHLGRQPRAHGPELILIGWNDDADTEHAVVVTVPLLDSGPVEELAAVAQLVTDGATEAAAVAFAPAWSGPDGLLRFVGACCYRYNLDLLDAVAVVGDRWRSLSCTDPGCCPPEGSPWPLETPQEGNPTP